MIKVTSDYFVYLRFKSKWRGGVKVLKRVGFTMFCCCCFTTGDVKLIQQCVKCSLSSQEQSELLDKVK